MLAIVTQEEDRKKRARQFDGVERVFCGGYWIKTYPVPADNLLAKKNPSKPRPEGFSTIPSMASMSLAPASGSANRLRSRIRSGAEARSRRHARGRPLFNRATTSSVAWSNSRAEGVEVQKTFRWSGVGAACWKPWNSDVWYCTAAVKKDSTNSGRALPRLSVPLETFLRVPLHQDRSVHARYRRHRQDHDRPVLAHSRFRRSRSRSWLSPPPPASRRNAAHRYEYLRRLAALRRRRRKTRGVLTDHALAPQPGVSTVSITTWRMEGTYPARPRPYLFDIARARVSMPKSTWDFVAHCEHYFQERAAA